MATFILKRDNLKLGMLLGFLGPILGLVVIYFVKFSSVGFGVFLQEFFNNRQLITSIGYDDNDEKLLKDFLAQGTEMLEKAGCTNIQPNDSKQAPGLDIHEMGGVRMGKDPKTSLLDKWNAFHNCKNVFVTDGACMTSVSTQNPSLTFMALTARAANYAVEELKKGNIV